MFEKAIKKYLESHSDHCCDALQLIPSESKYEHVLCIPARNEGAEAAKKVLDFAAILPPLLPPKKNLILILLNQRPSDENQEALEFLRFIQFQHSTLPQKSLWSESRNSLLVSTNGVDIFILDFATGTRKFGEKDGVGLARKILGDTALYLWSKGKIQDSFMRCSDADVIFPQNYFLALDTQNVAHIYPLEHVSVEGYEDEIEAYDFFLKYYQDGLKWADSHYAFQTIGSTICVRFDAYAAVRGFPKRLAGEDFYILNKLAKVGSIHEIQNDVAKLKVLGRPSNRVPFGTGAAVSSIRSQSVDNYRVYDPRVFIELKELLILFQKPDLREEDFNVLDDAELEHFLKTQIIPENSSRKRADKVKIFFDAFRTLKFIHKLSDQKFARIPWRQAKEQFKLLI